MRNTAFLLLILSSFGFSLSSFAQTEDPLFEAMKIINSANKTTETMRPAMDQTCACQIGEDVNQVNFESSKQCGESRNYLQGDLERFAKADPKGHFTKPRSFVEGPNRVPPKCVLFLMRSALRDRPRTPEEKKAKDIADGKLTAEEIAKKTYKVDPSQFATCNSENSEPQRTGFKPCVTEEYFNVIYNSLQDMAQCMDIPLKFALPKFANESGLHVNAFGPVNDAGIGQFTESALTDVADNYETWKNRIRRDANSGNKACQRLQSIPGALPDSAADIQPSDANRCHALSIPPNPVRSLIYYGIFYKSMKRNSETQWNISGTNDVNGESLDDLLDQAKIPGLDRKKLKEQMFVISYNTGPRPPITFMKEWLRYRMAKGTPITMKELDFNFWPPSGWASGDADAKRMVDYQAIENEWDEATTKLEYRKERNKRRAAQLIQIKGTGEPLTLPEYMAAYKDNIYLPAVKAQARQLDKTFGEGVCTQQNYL